MHKQINETKSLEEKASASKSVFSLDMKRDVRGEMT